MAAIDFDRVPTKVYETVKRSFEPVLASIEFDRDEWTAGAEVRCGIWAINDRWERIPNAQIRWRIIDAAGRSCQQGEWPISMAADSVERLGDVHWTAAHPGKYQLRAAVVSEAGEVISENLFDFTVTEPGSP
jgi:beta-mannosidase